MVDWSKVEPICREIIEAYKNKDCEKLGKLYVENKDLLVFSSWDEIIEEFEEVRKSYEDLREFKEKIEELKRTLEKEVEPKRRKELEETLEVYKLLYDNECSALVYTHFPGQIMKFLCPEIYRLMGVDRIFFLPDTSPLDKRTLELLQELLGEDLKLKLIKEGREKGKTYRLYEIFYRGRPIGIRDVSPEREIFTDNWFIDLDVWIRLVKELDIPNKL